MEGSAIFVLVSFSLGLFTKANNACFSHLCLPSALPQGLTLLPHTALLPRLGICSKFSSDGLRARKQTGIPEDCSAAERCSLPICAWKDCFWRLRHAEMITMCRFLSTGHFSASSQHFWEHSGVTGVLCSWWMESMGRHHLRLFHSHLGMDSKLDMKRVLGWSEAAGRMVRCPIHMLGWALSSSPSPLPEEPTRMQAVAPRHPPAPSTPSPAGREHVAHQEAYAASGFTWQCDVTKKYQTLFLKNALFTTS